ncbi:MAG: DNA methyltransferase, partial [Trebonia sp.]
MEIEVKAAFERIRGRIIDKEFVSQELLDVVERQRLSSFPWRGQFTPDLVGILLDTYGDSRSTVLDPFAGSGTTLAEATRHQMAAIGAEINPAALELARIFTMAELEPTARQGVLEQARQRLMDFILGRDGSLFGAVSDDILKDVVNV